MLFSYIRQLRAVVPWPEASGAGMLIGEVSLDRRLDVKQTDGVLARSNDGMAGV